MHLQVEWRCYGTYCDAGCNQVGDVDVRGFDACTSEALVTVLELQAERVDFAHGLHCLRAFADVRQGFKKYLYLFMFRIRQKGD